MLNICIYKAVFRYQTLSVSRSLHFYALYVFLVVKQKNSERHLTFDSWLFFYLRRQMQLGISLQMARRNFLLLISHLFTCTQIRAFSSKTNWFCDKFSSNLFLRFSFNDYVLMKWNFTRNDIKTKNYCLNS